MNKKTILSSLFVIIIMLGGLLFLTGCDNKQTKNTTTTSAKDLDYKNMTAEDLLSHIKDKNSVTTEEFIWLVSTYSNVDIKDDLTLEKNITDEAIKSLDSKAKPSLDSYLGELLKSESPQVRGYGISLITSILGVSSQNLELAKELIKNETEPYVLYRATQALSNEAKSSKEIADFLIKMASHENAKIRNASASALGNSWSQGVEGAVDTVIKLMNDKDTDVRKTACKYSGKLNDESVIEPLVAILNNAEEADLHGSCIEGLVTLWYDYPFFKNMSEKAYKATMDYLKTTPRTDKIPAWTAVGSFRTTSTQDSFKDWKNNATYFNLDEIYNIMVDIIKAHCSNEKFQELGKIVNELTDSKASSVKSAYDTKAK